MFHVTEANYRSEVPHFRIEFADPTSYVERYSPKGSCHHVESGMSDTFAQTCLSTCEVGMHVTYENSTSKPDRRKGCSQELGVSRVQIRLYTRLELTLPVRK